MVYSNGQELFGMEPSDYPTLTQIKKELNLLQKLYRLYNDVLDKVNSYYEVLWVNVNIEEINNELTEFQNRQVQRLIIASMNKKRDKIYTCIIMNHIFNMTSVMNTFSFN